MTVNITKPAINLRSELADLRKPTGIAGEAMLRADTPQEQFNLIGAGRRNLLINGAMQVAQRGTSFTAAANGTYNLDRFSMRTTGTYLNVLQDSDAPVGFDYSLKTTVNSANPSPSSGDLTRITYICESQDVSRLSYGNSYAQTSTLSFWVKSSIVGAYTIFMYAEDANRSLVKGYTINAADTWEYKTIQVQGDVTGSGFNKDNGSGLTIEFNLMAGSSFSGSGYQDTWGGGGGVRASGQTANCTTSSATWQITGVQLELGKVATPFEHRSYGEELALCQRYYWRSATGSGSGYQRIGFGYNSSTTNARIGVQPPVIMRSSPSLSFSGTLVVNDTANRTVTDVILDSNNGSNSHIRLLTVVASSLVSSAGCALSGGGDVNAYVALDAEL
jgi:hypothetical protein